MKENKIKETKEIRDEEIEQKLDVLWENWSSRRSCEQKHTPNYIKKQRDDKTTK